MYPDSAWLHFLAQLVILKKRKVQSLIEGNFIVVFGSKICSRNTQICGSAEFHFIVCKSLPHNLSNVHPVFVLYKPWLSTQERAWVNKGYVLNREWFNFIILIWMTKSLHVVAQYLHISSLTRAGSKSQKKIRIDPEPLH